MDRRAKSEQPLGEFSSCLSLWKISSIKLDIGRFSRTMFQELCLIAVIGIMAFLVDFCHTKYFKQNSTWEMFIPPIFILTLIVVKYFENGIVQRISLFANYKYEESTAAHKIAPKMIVLSYLFLVNEMADLADTASIPAVKGGSLKPKWFRESVLLQMWLDIATKLTGAFTTVTFLRLYLDVMGYAWQVAMHNPSHWQLMFHPKSAMMSRKLDKRILSFDENANILEEQDMSYNRYYSGENAAGRRRRR